MEIPPYVGHFWGSIVTISFIFDLHRGSDDETIDFFLYLTRCLYGLPSVAYKPLRRYIKHGKGIGPSKRAINAFLRYIDPKRKNNHGPYALPSIVDASRRLGFLLAPKK